MKKRLVFTIFIVMVVSVLSCSQKTKQKTVQKEYLPSWNEGALKNAIKNFVTTTTNKNNPNFIAIKDRIAVFDNDGTLWSEKPFYFQGFFAMDRVKELAPQHSEWKNTQPFKAILEGGVKAFETFHTKDFLKLVDASHSGVTVENFDLIAKKWFRTAKHPTLNKHYNQLVFQPMLELIEYLKAHDFKVFIVSGGGIDFIRSFGEDTYGIPRDQIIGTSFNTAYKMLEDVPQVVRTTGVHFIDDHAGKPVGIARFIGRKPVFSVGNSDGDKQMMDWTATNTLKNFQMYVHHTDVEREFAYDRHSVSGQFDKALDEAIAKKWHIIDMKKEWKVIYPFELDSEK